MLTTTEVLADPARAAGAAVGRILTLAAIVALIVVVIVLLSRRRRKKREQQHNTGFHGPNR